MSDRLISAEKLMEAIKAHHYPLVVKGLNSTDYGMFTPGIQQVVDEQPTVDVEPTEEQVKEYCRKRGLVIVDSELFNEMKARWSAEPARPGRWVRHLDTRFGRKLNDIIICSCCGIAFSTEDMIRRSYCPNCGAKMDVE